MAFAICAVAAAPVRGEPSHRAEMVNQLLFGESVQVLGEKEEWRKVKSLYDDYEGWVTYHLIENAETPDEEHYGCVAAGLLNPVRSPEGIFYVPMGASLIGFNKKTKTLWNGIWRYEGKYKEKETLNVKSLIETARLWLHVPYLWGGKTAMGVDCSGFVQTVFKVHGIRLKRDAYQQAEQGRCIESLSNAQAGDIAFFQNENGRIIHVGILLNKNEIIHASGKVRIDRLTEEGIGNTENGKLTHRWHSIRRMP